MLQETLDLNGCDEICGEVEELTSLELIFDGFVTTSLSSPLK